MVGSKRAVFGSMIAVAFVAALSLPVLGDEVATQIVPSQEATRAVRPATDGSPSEASESALPFLQDSDAFCPAEKPQSVEPEWLSKRPSRHRTCVCSCGYPCATDADCGGGIGSCRVGITCC